MVGEIRSQLALHPRLEDGDPLGRDAPAASLIGVARVGEPVAEHPHPAAEGRPDPGPEVIRPRRKEQEELRIRDDPLVSEQDGAEPLPEPRAARLAGDRDLDAAGPQRLGHRPHLGRLAGSVQPLEGDESTRHRLSFDLLRRRQASTARRCSARVSENTCRPPSPAATKNSSLPPAG